MKRFGLMLMAVLLALVPAYGAAQPAGPESPAAAGQPQGEKQPPGKSYTAAEKKAYQKKTAASLEELQGKIHDLSVKANTAAPQIKRAMLRSMVDLQRQVIAAKNRLTALERASEKDWGRLKADLDKTVQELTKNYEEAASRL